jgi:hypothetical protein
LIPRKWGPLTALQKLSVLLQSACTGRTRRVCGADQNKQEFGIDCVFKFAISDENVDIVMQWQNTDPETVIVKVQG